MHKQRFLCFGFLLLSCLVKAQSFGAYKEAAEKAYQSGDFFTAMEFYGKLMRQRPDEDLLVLRYAESAQAFGAYPEAERVLLKLYNNKKKRPNHPTLPHSLGQAYLSQGKYAKAQPLFQEFLTAKNASTDPKLLSSAEKALRTCIFFNEKISSEEKNATTIKNLGRSVNSPYSDFGATVLNDTLYFSSYRFEAKTKSKKAEAPKRQTKIMQFHRKGAAQVVRKTFPDLKEGHLAHPTFTPDGQYAFFNQCTDEPNGKIRCDLWLTARDGKGKWLSPVLLPEPFNTKGTTNTQPHVGYDAAAKQLYLYWASDRPGGKGGLDLWEIALDSAFFCPCTHREGQKSTLIPRISATASNLSELNTAEDEASPFFWATGNQLWFASNGHLGMGGYDIFYSSKNNGQWGAATHAGAGLNSAYNDLYPSLSNDGLKGYLSSNRPGALFLDSKSKTCCNDIYSFERQLPTPPKTPENPPTDAENPPNTPPLAANPKPIEPSPMPVAPPTTQTLLDEFKGLPLYFDNDEPDKRTTRTTTQKTYSQTFEPYSNRRQAYLEAYTKGLSDETRYEAEAAIDDFFNQELLAGAERLEELTAFLLQKLSEGERLEVFIKGYTSPRAQSDYNLNLGKRRVSSVKNHFTTWSEGAFDPYIRSGALKITEVSFGETKTKTAVSDRLDDERNSIYSPEAARERRVEIVEIRAK